MPLGVSWIDFWSILPRLGVSWPHLGKVWEGPWPVLGRLGGVLERLCGALGQLFEAIGSQIEAFHLGWHFQMDLYPIFGPKVDP